MNDELPNGTAGHPVIEPELRRFLDDPENKARPGWHEMGAKLARVGYRVVSLANGRGPTPELIEDLQIAGVPCRQYVPHSPLPGLICYFHGGGKVMGDLETHDATCRRVAVQSGRRVVAVDYRLAPEHPHPAAADDCEAVTRAAAIGFEVPLQQTVVMGDSAGGYLAAVVAIRLRDSGRSLAGQCLLYPSTDPTMTTRSYSEFATGYGLSAETMKWFWAMYLGAKSADELAPQAVPARVSSVDGLPPAFVLTCEFDVLRDEGEAYARRLCDGGVPTRLVRWPKVIHGFIQLAGVAQSGELATHDAADVAGAMIDGRFMELAMTSCEAVG